MPPTESEEIDCGEMGVYTTEIVPETCTVELAVNDTESEIINSLKNHYQDFPLRCRLRKYILYILLRDR